MIGWIGLISHYFGSLLGAIELLTILCAFVCKVGCLMPKLGRLYYTSRTYLSLWKKCY